MDIPEEFIYIKKYSNTVKYLKICDNINKYDKNGNNVLMIASKYANFIDDKVISLLLSNDIYINTKNNNGDTALLIALKNINYTSNLKIIKLLLSYGSDVNIKNNDDMTPLMIASKNINPINIKIINLLLMMNANINTTNNNNETALMILIKNSNYKYIKNIIKLYINHGANMKKYDKDENTILMLLLLNSFKEDYAEIINLCLKYEIDINKQNKDGDTSLIYLISDNNVSIIKLLLEAGSDPNLINNVSDAPLIINARINNCKEKITILKLLLKHGAMPNILDMNNETPLMINGRKKNDKYKLNIFKLLINNGANVNILNNSSHSLLWIFLTNDIPDTYKLKWLKLYNDLILHSPRVYINDIISSIGGSFGLLLPVLFGCYVNIMIKSITKRTYMHKILKLLLNNGANPYLAINNYDTSLLESLKKLPKKSSYSKYDYKKIKNIITKFNYNNIIKK